MDKIDKLVKLVLSELGGLTPKTKYSGDERTTSLYNKNGDLISLALRYEGDSWGIIDIFYKEIPNNGLFKNILNNSDYTKFIIKLAESFLPYFTETLNTKKYKKIFIDDVTEVRIILIIE